MRLNSFLLAFCDLKVRRKEDMVEGICAGGARQETAYRGRPESVKFHYGTLCHRLMEASLQFVSECSSARSA